MDFKAIISNCGDENVFKGLSVEVERRLPSAPVEWKRSYGRASKEVVLKAVFSDFNSDLLNSSTTVESLSKLTKKPLLHLFWTSCIDNDTYKSSIKAQISNWQKQLIKYENVDWMVVHVMYQESIKSGKSKLQLPRSSVYDKLKSDFGQDRCIQLWEPDKENSFTKSNESWQILLQNLRSSLLESFGRHLDKFEEKIRSMREKYADPKWPFIKYFLVHEELAFIYQSITLNEDALIQYDEVDALLSQFIINSSGKESPTWLSRLSRSPRTWDGVMLSSKVANVYKDVIESDNATLLDLRNYIFLRQCKLLIKMKRKWEIPSRLLDYLFAVIHELKLLKVDVPNYVVAGWIVLTCLQVLPVLEKDENSEHSFRATIAQTYDLMRQKIHFLGEVTGVYYNREQTAEERKILEHLNTGIGKYTENKNTSVKIIQEALDSWKSFEKLYIEITKACIDKYNDIGRLHSNIFVGLDLAKFYLQHGQYLLAEPLLEKSWSIYKNQKWETLYTDVLIPLAACQLKHELYDRYLNSVTLLSCAACLSFDTRDFYSKEVVRLSRDKGLNLPVTKSDTVFKIVSIKVALVKMKGHIGDTVEINVVINNQLTVPVNCFGISLHTKHYDLSNPDSFSENVLSARKSLFENKDYGMNSISPQEKREIKEEPVKETLTPSNLLKRIKSHRRTWSKNKNILDANENNKTNDETAPLEPLEKNEKNEVDGNIPTKRVLFTEDKENDGLPAETKSDEKNNKKTAEEVSKPEENVVDIEVRTKRSSLLELSKSSEVEKETPEENSKKADLSLDLTGLGDENASTPKKIYIEKGVEEENFDIVFKSNNDFELPPGQKKVKLTALLNHEGKYKMQSISCRIGHLLFHKQLSSISRKLGSFYMVNEPPRMSWTSSYLVDYSLTGSKQRIHVTVMNGPGVIEENSILHIYSKTGLKFYMMDESSMEIYPLERDAKAREGVISIKVDKSSDNAYLKLPLCKPYERVNVYFDVIAPMHQEVGQQSTSQHEINFLCQWLEHLSVTDQRLDVIFYEPFQLKCETIINSSLTILKITICGVNPVNLFFSNPMITSSKSNKQLELVTCNEISRVFNNEETIYLWKIPPQDFEDLYTGGKLNGVFSVNFKTQDDEGIVPEHFEKTLSLPVIKCLYQVTLDVSTQNLKKGEPCTAHVRVKKLFDSPIDNSKIVIKIDPREHFWRMNTKEEELVLEFSDDVTELSRELVVSCDAAGMISIPLVTLCIVDDVKMTDVERMTEVVTSFKPGEIDYISVGKMVFVKDASLVTVV